MSADSTVTAVDADTDDVARPKAGTRMTHSNSGEPNYDVVFPDDEANRIDITISAENWQLMLDDMTAPYGEQAAAAALAVWVADVRQAVCRKVGHLTDLPPGGTPPDGTPPGGTSPDGVARRRIAR